MIMDQLCLYSDGQAVSATGTSTNKLDNRYNGDDYSKVRTLFIHVGKGWTGGGTLTVALEHSDEESGSYTTADTLVNAAAASAVDENGFLYIGQLPRGLKRYRQLKYTITGTVTGLTVLAGENLGAPEAFNHDLVQK